jgi:RNA polymerase sigma factor (sigma-70 family)
MVEDRGSDAPEAEVLDAQFGSAEEEDRVAHGASIDVRRVELALQELEDDAYRTGRELNSADVHRAEARHRLSATELAVLQLRAEALGLLPLSTDDSLVRPIGHERPSSGVRLDALGRWLEDAAHHALLAPQQEIALARAIEAGAAASREMVGGVAADTPVRAKLEELVERGARAKATFIESNLRLVASIAKHYRGQGVDFVDLLQEGVLGLVRAVERFDWRLGYKFSTYATWWIRQSVHRAVDNQAGLIRIPVHMREKIRHVKRQRRDLELQMGRELSISELAEMVGIDPAEVAFLLDLDNDVISLDRPVGDTDGLRLGDLLASGDGAKSEFDIALDQTTHKELVAQFLALLSSREREVLIRRFGLDDGDPDTLEEIGHSWGVTRERIRQIESKALNKLAASKVASRERSVR